MVHVVLQRVGRHEGDPFERLNVKSSGMAAFCCAVLHSLCHSTDRSEESCP
jgi:hypothetical protein